MVFIKATKRKWRHLLWDICSLGVYLLVRYSFLYYIPSLAESILDQETDIGILFSGMTHDISLAQASPLTSLSLNAFTRKMGLLILWSIGVFIRIKEDSSVLKAEKSCATVKMGNDDPLGLPIPCDVITQSIPVRTLWRRPRKGG